MRSVTFKTLVPQIDTSTVGGNSGRFPKVFDVNISDWWRHRHCYILYLVSTQWFTWKFLITILMKNKAWRRKKKCCWHSKFHLKRFSPFRGSGSQRVTCSKWSSQTESCSMKWAVCLFSSSMFHAQWTILCPAVRMLAVGRLSGQSVVSCSLAIWDIICFRSPRWRLSLHSTHSNSIHPTRWHAALEISFVPWSHFGLKKAQSWTLIPCGLEIVSD